MKITADQCTKSVVELGFELAEPCGANTVVAANLGTLVRCLQCGIARIAPDNRGELEMMISIDSKVPEKTRVNVRDHFNPKAIGRVAVSPPEEAKKTVRYDGVDVPISILRDANTRMQGILDGLDKGTISMSLLDNIAVNVVPLEPDEMVQVSTDIHTFAAHGIPQLICWASRSYGCLFQEVWDRSHPDDREFLKDIKGQFAWIFYYLAYFPECHKYVGDHLNDPLYEDNPAPNYIDIYKNRVKARPIANKPAGTLPPIPDYVFDSLMYWVERYFAFRRGLMQSEGVGSALYKDVGKSSGFFTFFVIEGLFGHLKSRSISCYVNRVKARSNMKMLLQGMTSNLDLIRNNRAVLLTAMHDGIDRSKIVPYIDPEEAELYETEEIGVY